MMMFTKKSFAQVIADKVREEDKAHGHLAKAPLPADMQALLGRVK